MRMIGRAIGWAFMLFIGYFLVYMLYYLGTGEEEQPVASGGFETIRKEDFGDKWPFTVDQVRIGCERKLIKEVFADVDGRMQAYGLTGYAAQEIGKGIDDIWADNPNIEGAKISISPFIEIASKHCIP